MIAMMKLWVWFFITVHFLHLQPLGLQLTATEIKMLCLAAHTPLSSDTLLFSISGIISSEKTFKDGLG